MDFIDISNFDYSLPDEKIAKYPLEERDASKLLVYRNKQISSTKFTSLASNFPENALLIFNETKVVNARFRMQKSTGGAIEIFCLNPPENKEINLALTQKGTVQWVCMVGGLKKWKSGEVFCENNGIKLAAKLISKLEEACVIEFRWMPEHLSFSEILAALGELPLPPYMNRIAQEDDYARYQTVFAKFQGSVAAPTASLHFTSRVLQSLQAKGAKSGFLTLHVGAGTFKPVSVNNAIEHDMHPESFALSTSLIKMLSEHEGPIIPVGTTAMRTLESLYWFALNSVENNKLLFLLEQNYCYFRVNQGSLPPFRELLNKFLNTFDFEDNILSGQTKIMIRPGYPFQICDGIVTNFHQPKSTLLLLVSALIGEDWKKVYSYALDNDYRFLSYGDSSLLLR
jgi:S-adenosylmethionine:tRNA ribosyltransferase-isomerase